MIDYNEDGFIAKKDLGTDTTTGLTKQVRIVSLSVDTKAKIITLSWDLILASPTNSVMEQIDSGSFTRTGIKYEGLKSSQIGLGIKQMLESVELSEIENDLSNFPQCLVQVD